MLAHGIVRRVNVAIIDSGFWLDSAGHPYTDSKGLSDLPKDPVQYDFAGDDYIADGQALFTCTGGSSCPWHGNGSASVAVGIANNGTGAAGTGGFVADPMLFKIAMSDDQVARAVRTAVAWGADVISMSFGGDCNGWCTSHYRSSGYYRAFSYAKANGLVLVAAAGNDGEDTLEPHYTQPCEVDGVYCVGALEDGKNTSKSYSNYGGVGIWAPTDIHAMPDGGSSGKLTTHSGTSAACPFLTGIAAMVKAIDPSLDGERIKAIISKTAWRDSPDSEVGAYVNAYAAVVEAAGGYHIPPDIKITKPSDGDTLQPISGFYLTNFSAKAFDLKDGLPSVSWSSDKDGSLGQGASVTYDFTDAAEGDRQITATATNSVGLTASDTITVHLSFGHSPPQPVILQPQPNATIPPGAYKLAGYAKSTDPGSLVGGSPATK
ncbi:S8/S53 family peptidase [Candidatus Acetothermia bacterium]|nr:S8/S53 family peptidase [Candidatus Acetothermia bacterium]